ncbi:MAG: VCBS repeat-containing protein [Verrucomicrobia bacterium]|nr:VCBS repeat-containing protein [Verrucomicrobiota bacterium]
MQLPPKPRHKNCRFSRLLASAFWLLTAASAPAAGTNHFVYGDFERVGALPNTWDGVDSRGKLMVQSRVQPIIVEGATATSITFPSSVNFVDLDGDGKKDLVVGDSNGYIWWFKNHGEKGKPAFKTGKFFPSYYGAACKLYVCDWNADGTQDLVVGDSEGYVYVVPNVGSRTEPKFTTAMAKPRIGVYGNLNDTLDGRPLDYGKRPLIIGNYACPWVADWNGDGRPDLLVGEGTYSANSVWIFLNGGSAQNPRFEDGSKFPLIYGEGREQLTPAVCDWDGDGILDVLVGEREGRLCFYRGKQKAGGGGIAALQAKVAPELLDFTAHVPVGHEDSPALRATDLKNATSLSLKLKEAKDPFSKYLCSRLHTNTMLMISQYNTNKVIVPTLPPALVADLNTALRGEGFYSAERCGGLKLCEEAQELLAKQPKGADLARLNRFVLEAAFTEIVKHRGETELWPMVFACPCDWNEDGLLDLLFGRADGRIQVSLNKGEKGKPVMGPLQDMMGTDVEKDSVRPLGWNYAYSLYSNSCFMPEALQGDSAPGGETIKPKSGKYFLRWSYLHDYPGYNMFWEAHSGWGWGLSNWLPHTWELGGKWLRTPTLPLVIGKTYNFSFWYRGKDIKVNWFLGMVEAVENPGKRGLGSWEVHKVDGSMGLSPSWQQFTRTFVIPGSKDSRGQAMPFDLYLQMVGTGTAYFDDFRLEGPQ